MRRGFRIVGALLAAGLLVGACGRSAHRACQSDCRARHDGCLLAASTREAIGVCDRQASTCAGWCR